MSRTSAGSEPTDARPAYSGRVRYTPTASLKYQQRNPRRHEAEMRLIARAFQLVPPGRVLDVPCGGGRVGLWLARQGYTVTAADLSDGMLDITRQNATLESLSVDVQRQDVECLSFESKSFDAVVSFRLFHHFPNQEIRARAVAELCRVSRRHVLISYFNPWSTTALKQSAKTILFKRPKTKHPTSLSEVRGYFQFNGFQLVRDFAQMPFLHTLHLAVFERVV
jgi:2-polyprenyl-3-methyl-5-hydroxy-6-metoxy-1,4-benzoquinol methylase